MPYRYKNTYGMTLPEALVVISIFIIIMVAVTAFQVNVFSYRKSISDSFETSQSAQAILKIMIKELRATAPSVNGAYPITSVSTSSITFYSDIDSDDITEQITYSFDGNNINKSTIKASGSPLVYNPANAVNTTIIRSARYLNGVNVFSYFDEVYDGTTSPLSMPVDISRIRSISVTISLDVDPNRSPVPITYTSQAQLRNLKTNL